ncbi:YbaK/EbsC family protein [Patescibacteria group bacterium]|nr:YbaK/EbsC family protein [Patescibacteria group bacterium]MBU1890943.1 YbaK/EbsC family protein [Patescibacteria group bacterium]
MAVPKKTLSYLDKNKIKYEVVEHKTVFTAYDLAQTLKMKLPEIAKTLLVKVDKNLALTVIPASLRLDFASLKKIAKAKKVSIPKENVMKTKLKIKPGAITPFGQLYKIPVYLDSALKRQSKILVGSGSFEESIKMTPAGLIKLEEPTIGKISKKK